MVHVVHGEEGSGQGHQQRQHGGGEVIANGDRRLERQHADEVHGPDGAGQAQPAEQSPDQTHAAPRHVIEVPGDGQRAEATDAGDDV